MKTNKLTLLVGVAGLATVVTVGLMANHQMARYQPQHDWIRGFAEQVSQDTTKAQQLLDKMSPCIMDNAPSPAGKVQVSEPLESLAMSCLYDVVQGKAARDGVELEQNFFDRMWSRHRLSDVLAVQRQLMA